MRLMPNEWGKAQDALDGMSATPCGTPAGHVKVSWSPHVTLILGYVLPAQQAQPSEYIAAPPT